VLGSRRRSDQHSHARQPKERDVAALQRRGWSESKIEQWLSQHADTASRAARAQRVTVQSVALEARDWQQFLVEVLALRTAFIGLFLHWYAGSYRAY
jgi:hypothetical protein